MRLDLYNNVCDGGMYNQRSTLHHLHQNACKFLLYIYITSMFDA